MVTERLIDGTKKILEEYASMENSTTVERKVTEQILLGQKKMINKIMSKTSSLVLFSAEKSPKIMTNNNFKGWLGDSGASSHITHKKDEPKDFE